MSGRIDPIGRDVARRRAERRAAGRSCVLCGECDPEVLGERPASVLEEHHLAGRVNDEQLTVTLCLNCHRRLSARMPTAGIDLRSGGNEVERSVGLLRGLAVFFEQLAVALMRWARDLEQSATDGESGG